MIEKNDLQAKAPYDTLTKSRQPGSNRSSTIVQRRVNASVPSAVSGSGNRNTRWPSHVPEATAPIQKMDAEQPEKKRSWLDQGLDWFGKTIGKGVEFVVESGTNLVAAATDITSEIAGGVVGVFNEELGEDIREAGDNVSDIVRTAGDSVGDFSRDLVHGAIAGDAIENPNLAQMAGMTAVSFIPVVGQIADARDLVSGLASGDAGRIATAAAGFIPGAGDAAKQAGRAVDIIADGSKIAQKGGKAVANVAETAVKTGGKTAANTATTLAGTGSKVAADAAATGSKTAANVATTGSKTAANAASTGSKTAANAASTGSKTTANAAATGSKTTANTAATGSKTTANTAATGSKTTTNATTTKTYKQGTANQAQGYSSKGYNPAPGERTLEGYVKNNVSPNAELKLNTKSAGFNNNKNGVGGDFKRYGNGSHGGVDPHVHQPKRNVNRKTGEVYGGTYEGKTGTGKIASPTKKDAKQLYDYIENGKYR